MTALIAPHGGTLVDLYVPADRVADIKRDTLALKSLDLTARQLCDLELLANGGFSPLTGFMGRRDYESVRDALTLADGTVWPMPITLDVGAAYAATLTPGERIVLRDAEGVALAVLDVADIYTPDLGLEAERVFGTRDVAHPGVAHLLQRSGDVYLGGRISAIEPPRHYDYNRLRDTPASMRAKFAQAGWTRIVAFQTRNPLHRAHQELTLRAARQAQANLLIHPVVGMTKPGDVDHYSRTRCYEHVLSHYPEQSTALSLLPLAMRMGGPREALWHAIIRKNFGCTHFIVGRDHAGPGKGSDGRDFYGPYDAQELVAKYAGGIGIEMVPFREMVYVENRAEYVPADEVEHGDRVLNISGTEFRRRLNEGLEIPSWFSFPEIVEELRRTYPPRERQGFTVFFTGLSGAGKSTIANALCVKLLEHGGRSLTLLDGDVVRKNLSSELGFSREHRDLNILRIGYVAAEITKAGGIAVCAPIAPYVATRARVRELVAEYGGFVEVHISTPLEVCEQRDRKGLYAKARAGVLKEFTGISDPYEAPTNAEVVIDTLDESPDQAAQRILLALAARGFIR